MDALTELPFSAEIYPNLHHLLVRQLATTPHHQAFLERRYAAADADELLLCEDIAREIRALAGDNLSDFLNDYEFICRIQKDEELYFRRNKEYRLKTFKDADEQVYSNRPYMQQYMRGLLMTQLHWSNHTASMGFYEHQFLDANPPDSTLVEIGPGHGLLLARAANHGNIKQALGWDLSDASLAETEDALGKIGAERKFKLERMDLYEAPTDVSFDAIVFSEVLEHLEEPETAIRKLGNLLRLGGRLYVNVPINSPQPDHLFLLRSPEEAIDLVAAQGLNIECSAFYPATNYTLEMARKHALTVSVCIIATKS
jgi:2-polyprenyl-3-methyl-5-hydroxy-6-metoxy-1,4-benzoquinol methylase